MLRYACSAIALIFVLISPAYATHSYHHRSHHSYHRHHYSRVVHHRLAYDRGSIVAHHRRYGACDGIHRCICGSTQARHFGLPRMYHGHNLWEAREWGRAFPHTTAHAGAVVVKPHHVAKLVSVGSNCGDAIVSDDRGTHRYNICGAQFVDVR